MNLTLTRKDYLSTGIFGEIDSDDESLSLYTLEHAYLVSEEGEPPMYQPKVPPGSYVCKRGMHQLVNMFQPLEMFEITAVPGHTEILFHVGNINDDSSGCVLVGLFRNGDLGIMQSRNAFARFMDVQSGIDEFILTVI